MKNENWEPCPRCGSNRVQSRGGCLFAMLGFAAIGVFFWITFLIPPVGIVGMIAGVVILIISPFAKGIIQCQDCNKAWKASKA